MSLSQEEPAPEVEVTPELDLEVVPESSGDWHNVFPWPQTTRVPESKSTVQCTEHWLSFTNKQRSFAKHFPPLKGVIWLEKDWRHCWFTPRYIEGFYPRSSPLLFIQISSEVRGVWFPVIGLMTFICFATVWLSSIWWPPERFGWINPGIPDNSPVWRCSSIWCWPCWEERKLYSA